MNRRIIATSLAEPEATRSVRCEEMRGTPGEARTPDLWLRRPPLYPTELRAQSSSRRETRLTLIGSGRRDLNPRHPAPKAGALPGCATPRDVVTAAREQLIPRSSRGDRAGRQTFSRRRRDNALGLVYTRRPLDEDAAIQRVRTRCGGRSSVGRASDCGSDCRGFETRRSPPTTS